MLFSLPSLICLWHDAFYAKSYANEAQKLTMTSTKIRLYPLEQGSLSLQRFIVKCRKLPPLMMNMLPVIGSVLPDFSLVRVLTLTCQPMHSAYHLLRPSSSSMFLMMHPLIPGYPIDEIDNR